MFIRKKGGEGRRIKRERDGGPGGKIFLREECQLKILSGMIEFFKSPFCSSRVVIDSCKLPKWMLTSTVEKLLGNKIFIDSKYHPTDYLLITKGNVPLE